MRLFGKSTGLIFVVAAPLAAMTSPVCAEVTFEWVTVGNPGNAPDPLNSPGGPCEACRWWWAERGRWAPRWLPGPACRTCRSACP